MTAAVEHDMIIVETDGATARFVLPAIPSTVPESVRHGLAYRRLAAIEGVCARCGGRRRPLTNQQRLAALEPGARLELGDVRHLARCAAVHPDVKAYLAGKRDWPARRPW